MLLVVLDGDSMWTLLLTIQTSKSILVEVRWKSSLTFKQTLNCYSTEGITGHPATRKRKEEKDTPVTLTCKK